MEILEINYLFDLLDHTWQFSGVTPDLVFWILLVMAQGIIRGAGAKTQADPAVKACAKLTEASLQPQKMNSYSNPQNSK